MFTDKRTIILTEQNAILHYMNCNKINLSHDATKAVQLHFGKVTRQEQELYSVKTCKHKHHGAPYSIACSIPKDVHKKQSHWLNSITWLQCWYTEILSSEMQRNCARQPAQTRVWIQNFTCTACWFRAENDTVACLYKKPFM